MRKPLPGLAPLGRLYDPLLVLAARIHRIVGAGHRTIWADDQGGVYTNCVAGFPSRPERSIVGTYNTHTPLFVIEDDLRLALRARASRWITDWNAQPARVAANANRPKSSAPARGRSLRVRAAIQRAPLQGDVVGTVGRIAT